ncbi:hypothetical protein [Cohnella fermenti]|nr:hypothetical protein [Cohnella fermenti]
MLRLANAVVDRWTSTRTGSSSGEKGQAPLGYRLDDHYGWAFTMASYC